MSPTQDSSHNWPRERVEQTARAICDPPAISELLRAAANPSPDEVRDILYEAGRGRGLTAAQAATLLQVTDPPLREQVKEAARQLHERLFARRVRLLAPVCPTNRCINECLYCPLRRSNPRLRRTVASARDLQREVTALVDEGHRHLTLVFGEDRSGIHYACDMVNAAYGVRSGTRRVHRVDLNLNSSHPEELAALAQIERLGTYHVYQETYDPETYARLHVDGPKQDYAWRLTCHDRACEAGLRDVGLGVLLGLHDPRFDVLAVLIHAQYLLERYNTAAEVITYPRLLPVPEAPVTRDTSWQVDDEAFGFYIAVTRLVAPVTEIVLSTPATPEVRRQLYALGVSQVSVGSLSYPGVYSADGDPEAAGSLRIGRPRNLETLVYRMCEVGFVPNFCVECYAQIRQKLSDDSRQAERYPVHRAAANSLLALKEYLLDYASPETQNVAAGIIQEELARLPRKVRDATLDLMEEAEAGLRGQML